MANSSDSSSSNSKESGGSRAKPLLGKQGRELAALALWLGGFHLNFSILCFSFLLLPKLWAVTVISIWLSQLFIPAYSDTEFAKRVAEFVAKTSPAHFPVTVHVEEIEAFESRRSVLLAVEPHSVLPLGMIAFTKQNGLLPGKNVKFAGSSALLWTPVVSHVWRWLGLIPANRKMLAKALNEESTAVALVPGGVQECILLTPGQETIFLRKRFGFVRCAIETGAPLVPVFCFGQTEAYHYLKPTGKWYSGLSRMLRFTPLVFWGMYGSFIPFRQPITVVVGKPIEVTKNAKPSRDEVAALLETFIGAMEVLFEKYKAEAGYKDIKLKIL